MSLSKTEPFPVGAVLHGRSGRRYGIEEILSERRDPLLCVYRARYVRTSNPSTKLALTSELYLSSVGAEKFVLKNMIPGDFEYNQDLQNYVASCPNLRTAIDAVPDFELLVYPFLAGDLFAFSKALFVDWLGSTKRASSILFNFLLSRLQPRFCGCHPGPDVLADIKPNNILLDYDVAGDDITVRNVQVSDLEDAVVIPPGKNLKDCLRGNQLWRSPESWVRARQSTPSDIYSFGVVIIYVMLNEMVFRARDEELAAKDAWRHVLRRHISYFADDGGIKGLLSHIGEDNPFFDRLIDLAAEFGASRPRSPFALWQYVDEELRDLIGKMTNFDPARRITAHEALEHPWFSKGSSD
ncbi:Putative protein kinase [Colletotrichum destructivum]|uniref:Protein kinase domain-containing protein n=1 Tax=Colletotrichum destructivum TaxID=34406 RepID=A0AAX4INA7_9PEZI|nr:Putative protein kinase [Colletotrichum destructivum]